jgi:hypothetical protein
LLPSCLCCAGPAGMVLEDKFILSVEPLLEAAVQGVFDSVS